MFQFNFNATENGNRHDDNPNGMFIGRSFIGLLMLIDKNEQLNVQVKH